MKKNGFTLIELLATVTIIGLVMLIALPQISKMGAGGKQKQYEAYQKTVSYAGKLYTDSYSDDLFGKKENGCAIVSYDALNKKKLVGDIRAKNISCATDDTYVVVIKNKGKYYYKGYIGCGTKNASGKIENIELYPKTRTGVSACDDEIKDTEPAIEDSNSADMVIEANPTNYSEVDKKSLNVEVSISSPTGIKSAPVLQYAFTNSVRGNTSSYSNLSFSVPSASSQKSSITNGNIPTAKSIVSLSGKTGSFYLVVKVVSLYDLDNKAYSSDDNYLLFGPYTIDNRNPVFDGSSSVVSSVSGKNAKTPKLNINAHDLRDESDLDDNDSDDLLTDEDLSSEEVEDDDGEETTDPDESEISEGDGDISDDGSTDPDAGLVDDLDPDNAQEFDDDYYANIDDNSITYETVPEESDVLDDDVGTSQKELKMCVKYGSECGTTAADVASKYETYNPTKVLPALDSFGKTYTIYVTVVDKAYNFTTKSFSYKVDDDNIVVKYSCGKVGGTTSNTTCKRNSSCTLKTQTCSNKCKNSFKGWYTKSSGGTKYKSSAKFSSDTTVYAQWKTCKTVEVKFKRNGSSGKDVTKSCTISGGKKNCSIKTPKISRDKWTKIGWGTKASATKKSKKANTNYKFTKNATYYAITSKKATANFNYEVSKEQNLSKLNKGSHPKTKVCTIYNKNTTCAVKTPDCDFGKTYNSKNKPMNTYFNCTWSHDKKKVTATKKVEIKNGWTFKLSATAKAKYKNSGKVILLSHTGSENICVRGGKSAVFNYGISTKTLDGHYNDKTAFDWNGSWIIDKKGGLLWFYGTGRKKGVDCTSIKTAKLCSSSKKAKMTNWISARLSYPS